MHLPIITHLAIMSVFYLKNSKGGLDWIDIVYIKLIVYKDFSMNNKKYGVDLIIYRSFLAQCSPLPTC